MAAYNLKTQFNSPGQSPGFLLWQITNKWQAAQRAALKPYSLTHVQFVLLATLTWNGQTGLVTQQQLAHLAQTDIMMTSQVVRTLERKKLITRKISKKDARAFILEPTAHGTKLVNKAIQAVERVDESFFATLGNSLPDFVAMMQQL